MTRIRTTGTAAQSAIGRLTRSRPRLPCAGLLAVGTFDMRKVSALVALAIGVSSCGSGPTSANRGQSSSAPPQTLLSSAIIRLGTGGCATTLTRVVQVGEELWVELQMPTSAGCRFESIDAYVGSQTLRLRDTRGGISKNSNGSYVWTAKSGFLIFRPGRSVSNSEASAIRLHETTCQDTSCITSFPDRIAKPVSSPQQSRGSSEAEVAGALLGIALVGAAIYGVGKMISGAGDSSSTSSVEKHKFSCSYLCRGSLYATGARHTVNVWGKDETSARESIKNDAEKICRQENSGRAGAWWADMSICKSE